MGVLITLLQGINKLREAWPIINQNFTNVKDVVDGHVAGTSDKHTADKIEYTAGGYSIKSKYDNHVAGLADKHNSDNIDNVSDVVGENISEALGTLENRIDNIVSNAGSSNTEIVDSRFDDLNNIQYALLKDRLDAMTFITYEGKKFIINNPYSRGGSLSLKGQLHSHTTFSDGADTPAVLGQAYKDAGYDFLAITDHDAISSDPSVSGLIFIPGIEEIIGGQHPHVTAFDVIDQTTETSLPKIIDYHRKKNRIVSIAHPGVLTPIMPLCPDRHTLDILDGYNFIEVYNSLCLPIIEDIWDRLLSNGSKVFATAVDDCHDKNGSNFNKGWVVVFANNNTKIDILRSLRKGNFYSSTGNDITITLSGNIITATSSNNSNFKFIGKNGYIYQTNSNVLNASYTINGDEGYIRVLSEKVSDGKLAWSQPIFIDELNSDKGTKEALRNSVSGIYKQPLVNADFDIWQDGTSFTLSGYQPIYGPDQWFISASFASYKVERIEISELDAMDMGKYCARLTATTKGTGTDLSLLQPLRTVDSLPFKGKTVSIGIWLRKNSIFNAGNVELHLYSGTGIDEKTVSTNRIKNTLYINSADLDTEKFKLFQFTADVNWDRTQIGVVVKLADIANMPDGSSIDIKRIQINIGDKILPYDRKRVDEILFDCQAFYEKSYNLADAPGTATTIGTRQSHAFSAYTLYNASIQLKRSKIKTPIISIYSTTGEKGYIRDASAGANRAASVNTSCVGENNFLVAGSNGDLVVGNSHYFHYVADSRL